VLKSTNRGENLIAISPDLTTRDPMKIKISTQTTGGITPDNTGAETHCTITALAESPIRPGLLYAGTDDGNVWLSRNDGATWENLTGRFAGVPKNTWVNRIEPSSADTNVFYVAFDGHRTNDFTPYVFITKDYGKTFSSIVSNLPTGGPDFVHVIREDPYNPSLLFVGTDVGAYVSTNRGGSWQKFMNGLPTVPVHDLRIHPRDHELIAGTHGRSIWIVDITPLEQMKDSLRDRTVALYAPKVAYQYGEPTVEGQDMGQFVFEAPSPAYGADIWYRLASGTRGQTKITISDVTGDTIATVNGPASAGLHKVTWDFRGKAPKAVALSPSEKRDSIVQARRVTFVADSLEKAGTLPAPMIARIKTAAASGDQAALMQIFGFGRGGRGGGGGAQGGFQERPGEGPMPRSANAAQGQRGQRGEGAGESSVDPSELREIAQLFRAPGSRGFGGFGRGGAPTVGTGDYLVSMTVDGKKYTQVLHVERRSGGDSGGFFGGEDDEEHEP
jgi:hypothetical protein